MQSALAPSGTLSARKVKTVRPAPLAWRIRNKTRPAYWLGYLFNQAARLFTRITQIPCMIAELRGVLINADGQRIDYGVLGYRQVTTAFVNFVTDQLQTETSEFGDFKYHDSGEGNTAEDASDTDIETTDGESRATGTQTENAANIYESVGTISYTTTKAIVEHGLFSQSTGTTLMDRTVFSTINVGNGDSIEFTYRLTLTAGS